MLEYLPVNNFCIKQIQETMHMTIPLVPKFELLFVSHSHMQNKQFIYTGLAVNNSRYLSHLNSEIGLTMKMIMKIVVWNIVVDKEPLMLRYTITHKRDQMAMVYSANNFNFCSELTLPLSTTDLQLFHGDLSAIYQDTFVYTAKSTFT